MRQKARRRSDKNHCAIVVVVVACQVVVVVVVPLVVAVQLHRVYLALLAQCRAIELASNFINVSALSQSVGRDWPASIVVCALSLQCVQESERVEIVSSFLPQPNASTQCEHSQWPAGKQAK